MATEIKPWELREAYERQENIMALLRQRDGEDCNTERIIELSYDLQSGNYIRQLDNIEYYARKLRYTACLAGIIDELGGVNSLLDAGMGEGTTLWGLLSQIKDRPRHVHGFDLCWSRVAVGQAWLRQKLPEAQVEVCVASLSEVPYADNSFEMVYTAHALEPNRGRERELLSELMRVTAKWLLLLEPAYEFASDVAKQRMDSLGYCRGLAETAASLGLEVVRHGLFEGNWNENNPTALILLHKTGGALRDQPERVCPAFHTSLEWLGDCYFSERSMRAYPLIGGIPCLRSGQGIIASQLSQTRALIQ